MTPLLSLLLLAPLVWAGGSKFTITEPTQASYWVTGTPVSIVWSLKKEDRISMTSTLRIDLCIADGHGLRGSKVVATIAGMAPASAGSVSWTAPWVPEVSNKYFIRLERNKEKTGLKAFFESTEQTESPHFRIEPAPKPAPEAGAALAPIPTTVNPPPGPPPVNVTAVTCDTVMKAECTRLGYGYAGDCKCGPPIKQAPDLSVGARAMVGSVGMGVAGAMVVWMVL